MHDNDLPAPVTRDAQVQAATESHFFDKIMFYQISMMTAAGMGNCGTALSASSRRGIFMSHHK
ncbi:hypothetical protein C1N70_14190 [Cytobacillus firmus]